MSEADPGAPAALAVDLGKTSCRARVTVGGVVYYSSAGGAPGLASHDGADRAREAIRAAIDGLPGPAASAFDRIGIGAAGVDAGRDRARELAAAVSEERSVPVVILTDALTAHAGALGGDPGTVLIAGTGAVAYGLAADGRLTRSDGWGPLLGDEGSGRWIGQEGLASALRGGDGRGPATALSAAAIARAGSLEALPSFVASGSAPERVLGSFAPDVLRCASDGDAEALRIVDDAVRLLTRTAVAAAIPAQPVSVLGGLTGDADFAGRLAGSLVRAGLSVQAPRADALAGAELLALRTDLPHERYAIRV